MDASTCLSLQSVLESSKNLDFLRPQSYVTLLLGLFSWFSVYLTDSQILPKLWKNGKNEQGLVL